MTVSRALRGEPRVAPATRERIVALAEAMRYRPDPDLARLMHRVRSRKTVKIRAVIAVIREWVPGDDLLSPYQRRDHLAASAVDLSVTQLSQHERGVPAVARQFMIPPQWVPGASVRRPV